MSNYIFKTLRPQSGSLFQMVDYRDLNTWDKTYFNTQSA